MELFIIRISKRQRGQNVGGGGQGEHILLTPKYLDQFIIVLYRAFTTGLIFARQSKQGAATLF